MAPGPRDYKQSSLRVAIAECLPEEMHSATREIVSLESTNPRKGHATSLMWMVCHEADTARIALIVQPKSFGDGGMDDSQLEKFYMKFGFEKIQELPVVLMARRPVLSKRIARIH